MWSNQEPFWPDKVDQQEVLVGLEREGALADHPFIDSDSFDSKLSLSISKFEA